MAPAIESLATPPRPQADSPPAAAHTSRRPGLTVVYDGLCSLCTASVRLLKRLDFFGRLEFVDFTTADLPKLHPDLTEGACLAAMQVITPDGKLFAGFFGFKEISRRLPQLWPACAVVCLPGMSRLGPAVYRFIAAHRPRAACATDRCRPSAHARPTVRK